MIVAEGIGGRILCGCHGAQSGIGVLPVSLFGTDAQKQKIFPGSPSRADRRVLPDEAQAGSDALAVRTRADLSADGTHYVLNGQKMWITNGGIAICSPFRQSRRRTVHGISSRARLARSFTRCGRKEMGLRAAHTAVFFDNVKVPVENVLARLTRHIIAFNISNLGA
jgi:alkylation response protein AidB-like acyl-CoA dehydrogenase